MELWEQKVIEQIEQVNEYCNRAKEAKDIDEAIGLLDRALSLSLQTAKQAKLEEIRLSSLGNARTIEANKYMVLVNKLVDKANTLSGSERAEYLREAASYTLSSYSSSEEAAELAKEVGDIALYHNRMAIAYREQAVYHYFLAWASEAVDNWDEALSGYKESLPLFETALEHFNKSLRLLFHPISEDSRKNCIDAIEMCRSNIRKAESNTTDLKTTGTPRLSVSVTADYLKQDTYSPLMLKIVNVGDGFAKNVKIRLDAPVKGETTASLETMREEYETELALSVKPLEHGRMKFKIYVEYRDMQGRKDTAVGEAWMQVARLTEQPTAQQVFHISNFTGAIGRDKQIVGGDIVGGSKTGDVGMIKGGIGSDEKPFSNCPYCGEELNFPKPPKFCPYCGEQINK